MLSIFSCTCLPLVYLICKMSIQIFCPIFFNMDCLGIFSSIIYLCILEINTYKNCKRTPPSSFYKASITLIPKANKDFTVTFKYPWNPVIKYNQTFWKIFYTPWQFFSLLTYFSSSQTLTFTYAFPFSQLDIYLYKHIYIYILNIYGLIYIYLAYKMY